MSNLKFGLLWMSMASCFRRSTPLGDSPSIFVHSHTEVVGPFLHTCGNQSYASQYLTFVDDEDGKTYEGHFLTCHDGSVALVSP